jgi:hypothetical protein
VEQSEATQSAVSLSSSLGLVGFFKIVYDMNFQMFLDFVPDDVSANS